jgi:Matrixin
MHTGRVLGVVALATMAALSCGGGGAQSPTKVSVPVPTPTPRPSGWPEGTVLSVVSGETQDPVSGAKVVVAGTPRLTDADGKVAVAAAAEGATVDVEAEGFLTRQTLVRYGETRLSLWPEREWLSERYTQKLVYTSSTAVDSESPVPLICLPPKVRTLSLQPSDSERADRKAMDAHATAAESFNLTAQGRVTFSVDGAADMTVPTRIDPADEYCQSEWSALTRLWASTKEVTRAEIVFCSEKPSRLWQPILHEMGHVYGLRHSSSPFDVMYPIYNGYLMTRYGYARYTHGFTYPEEVTMALIFQRRGGNVWPDNDRTATSGAAQVLVFAN